MPHQNLPSELEEEFEGQLYDFFDDNQLLEAVYEKPKMETIKSFLLKCYEAGKAAGYKEGLLGAMEEIPPKEEANYGQGEAGAVWAFAFNVCRTTLLSRLEERLKRSDDVQE